MAFRHALERKNMAHLRMQQPRIYEPRDACEDLSRAATREPQIGGGFGITDIRHGNAAAPFAAPPSLSAES